MTKVRTLALLFFLFLFTLIPAAKAQTYTVLYNFGSKSGDPLYPFWQGTIAQGRDGNLYSTTGDGGADSDGTVFSVTPTGALTVLYSFTSSSTPESGLTLGTDGNFYGTTQIGGSFGAGQVFGVSANGTLTVLYTFTEGDDGSSPFAAPIQGTDGDFYGTTVAGGTFLDGTIYKMMPTGTLTTLHSFNGSQGANPRASLVQGTDGNFYGTTFVGGSSGQGVVYKITPSGTYTVLYDFDGTHGANPIAPLVQGKDGNFYGTTEIGGTANSGVIFKITSNGTLTVLHSLNGTSDGGFPYAGLVQATDGNFYGATSAGASSACSGGCGTLFQITPAGTYVVVHTFDYSDGWSPSVTLTQHTNGILYGDAENGGGGCASPGCGVFYSLSMGLPPFTSLVTASGRVGKSVGMLGQGFTGTTAVSFNGTAASFTVISATYLTANVPAGASTGPVKITTPGGILTSNKAFRVTPQIKSFSPLSGPVGTPVTITGVSLTQTKKVTFEGVAAASFTVDSDTQVTATVPAGAKTGKIAITTPGGIAVSATSFTVTP